MNNFHNDLGDLSDPGKVVEAVELGNISTQLLLNFFRDIYLIRRCEETIGDLSKSGEIRTPVHLGIGQEGVAVGVAKSLRKNDRVFSNHRSHSHYLSMGASIEKLFAEVLGKASGASKGMGGSMHLVDREVGFWGSVPIVGGTIPLAVGAGLAAKRDGEKSVAVAYFGDGACEEGVLHESLNLAQVMQLPVIFVCENNLYSSHMDMHLRQPSNSVSRFAEEHKMNSYLLDGNDVVKVATFAEKAIRRARNGDGPSFVEAVTFRWRGHVGPEMDLDVGVKRSAEELAAWMQLDPLKRIEDALRKNRNCEDGVFEEIKLAVDKSIEENLSLARAAEDPNLENLLGFVYEKN